MAEPVMKIEITKQTARDIVAMFNVALICKHYQDKRNIKLVEKIVRGLTKQIK